MQLVGTDCQGRAVLTVGVTAGRGTHMQQHWTVIAKQLVVNLGKDKAVTKESAHQKVDPTLKFSQFAAVKPELSVGCGTFMRLLVLLTIS